MDRVLQILSNIYVIIAIAIIVVLLIIWFIVQRVRSNKYRNQLQALEVRYNQIKSVPLSFKLNKAVAISRVDPEAMQNVAQMKDDFDKAEANLKQISQTLADAEDEILVGKLKKAQLDLADLNASIALGETQVANLDKFLDQILERETQQRQEVTELKNRFRDLKNKAQDQNSQLSYVWSSVQGSFTDIEKMFSSFEEWMYAQDFEKASNELSEIETSIDQLETTIDQLPVLLQDARGVVPKMAEVLHHDYTANRDRGVYLRHLEVEKNLSMITAGLKQDLANLKAGDASDVAMHLDDYKRRLQQMDEAVKKESDAFDQLSELREKTNTLLDEANQNVDYVQDQYEKMNVRLGLDGLDTNIEEQKKTLEELAESKTKIDELFNNPSYPASETLLVLQEMSQKLTNCNNELNSVKDRIDGATSDEDRAKKQLVKLQVIMNQMDVSIRKYKLPSISSQYEEDMTRANQYIRSLENLIDETPLNVRLLNSTLNEAIDFIYKLYNNVNNVVGAVVMVENTIVFGNRYRSTYADIDSELTRSELNFRNGDYTQALTTAIATIEKIHPGNYEKMVRENAKGGEE